MREDTKSFLKFFMGAVVTIIGCLSGCDYFMGYAATKSRPMLLVSAFVTIIYGLITIFNNFSLNLFCEGIWEKEDDEEEEEMFFQFYKEEYGND